MLSQYAAPMFHLKERSVGRDCRIDVEVNGIERPLRQFVGDLLTKKLRYSQSRVVGGIKAAVQLWSTSCSHCGYTIHFFNVDDLQARTECGANIAFGHNRYSLLYPKSYKAFVDFYMMGIPHEIRDFMRVESQAEEPFYEFICTGCGKTRLSEKPSSSMRIKNLTSLVFTAPSELNPDIVLNHWCDSPLCRAATPGSLGEVQDSLTREDLRWKCTAIRQFERKIDYKQRLPYRQFASYPG